MLTAARFYAILTFVSPSKTTYRPAPKVRPAHLPPKRTWLEILVDLAARFQRFTWDVAGVLLLAIALMTLLALILPELTGGMLLQAWGAFLQRGLGWGGILVVVATTIAGLLVLRLRVEERQSGEAGPGNPLPGVRWGRIIALEAAAFAVLAMLTVINNAVNEAGIRSIAVQEGIAVDIETLRQMASQMSVERAEQGLDGGLVGWGLAELLLLILSRLGLGSPWLAGLLLAGVIDVCLLYSFGLVGPLRRKLRQWAAAQPSADLDSEPMVSLSDAAGETVSPAARGAPKRRESLPPQYRKKFQLPRAEEKNGPSLERAEHLPPLELLVHEQSARPDERSINQTAGLIEKTLAEFGIPAKVVGFRIGPTVTQFAVEPGFLKNGEEEDVQKQKVRVAQIAGLRRDLALALAAERLRIEAPVPGRPYLGIEVPNSRTTVVRLRPVLESEAFYKVNSPLAIALGRDVSGQPVVGDLSSMPHLLIAGTTGSGKSVCIAALTACLVMNNTPEDLRLVMIDPKMVELVRFNGLPHLYGKVETDIQRILGVMRWVVMEMDRRYKLLEELHARNLDAYNRKARRQKGKEPLPHLVVMIDELADLMMTAPDQTEHMLIRLAQMARATGIHLVVATQRPSTDVVTGLIKANFPARIAFAVASSVDSRVVLDVNGAETLLGHGDMLFLPPEASAPMRAQGVMVSDQEVEKVITYWQRTHPKDPSALSPWEAFLEEQSMLAERDDLVSKAIEMVRGSQRASASLLQRRLHIGYPRAARLMDELEQLGVVGPAQGGGRERDVLIGEDDDHPLQGS